MAAYISNSHSLRVSDDAPQQLAHTPLPPLPFTPVHSPHHSVNSSVSSPTPIHTLSIHEYRKQQHTPNSQIETPSGRTLRRRAATPVLNTAQLVPKTQSTRSAPHASYRPLHSSQSAHQLNLTQPSLFQKHQFAHQLTRAQSAEPRAQGGSISSISTTTSSGKVGHFKSRKRLPKPPPFATDLVPLLPHFAPVKSTLRHPTLSTAPDALVNRSNGDTTSTISLSRFPKPPHLADPAFSPPHHENEPPRINALSYTSATPVTPPTTPAIIHYRGASFDLVNPHDSLLLHDIVTPSRDFGSSEYLLVPPEEPFSFAEMAPKRALYGDFGAAHAGIRRRADDSFNISNLDLPLPPVPTAVSPGSSAYTSPVYSPDSDFAPPPLAVTKAQNDSRFSLKQLTRTLTKRLGKTPEKHEHGRELQELRVSNISLAPITMEGERPRPIDATYVKTPQPAYFPIGPMSPVTPTSPTSPPQEVEFGTDQEGGVEVPRKHIMERYDSEPLASLLPGNDYPSQIGRGQNPRISVSDRVLASRPYYEDLESIYASSSIYTADGQRKSVYQQNFGSAWQSNPFVRYSAMGADSFASEYNHEDPYGYGAPSDRKSETLSGDMYRRVAMQEKTDTISKIIDQYDPNVMANNAISMQTEPINERQALSSSKEYDPENLMTSALRIPSGTNHFEFGFHDNQDTEQVGNQGYYDAKQPILPERSPLSRDGGLPPHAPAPLAPPFQYGDGPVGPYHLTHPESSAIFSNQSYNSYGDTRNLLEIPHSSGLGLSTSKHRVPTSSSYSQPGAMSLEPSSSYSQPAPSAAPPTPQEALDHADEIFQNAAHERKTQESIPAIWSGRGSGSLLLAKKISAHKVDNRQSTVSAVSNDMEGDGNEADWESVVGHSQGVRDSYGGTVEDHGSIADYSSSEGTRNSLTMDPDVSLPPWHDEKHSRGLSIYSHPSPIRAHHNPFTSSPPQLQSRGSIDTAPGTSGHPLASSPPGAMMTPAFRFSDRALDVQNEDAAYEIRDRLPWEDKYALSDKETQELLASGPNDEIMIDTEGDRAQNFEYDAMTQAIREATPLSSSPAVIFDGPNALERENTFEKLCVLGPKGNFTGTPRGSGMHETGSSVADTSSPGHVLPPRSARQYPGFYASPFLATGSITTIQQSRSPVRPEYERTPSEITLFPRSTDLEPVTETSPDPGARRRESLRSSTTFQKAQRRMSRSNVPGQTKLRHMVLAPDAARKTLSSADTSFSHFMHGSERPSTCDTSTPLHPETRHKAGTLPTFRTLVAHQHSPHLLTVEKDIGREEEERRRKLSWAIFAVFCILPPCMFLYRIYGDRIMVSLTKGQLGNCTSKSKRVALISGIAVNVSLITAIVVPVVVIHALGAA
ncbi:hypothetical protein ACEQ8H_004836 [Pleosporales sp. CAS-2024a]